MSITGTTWVGKRICGLAPELATSPPRGESERALSGRIRARRNAIVQWTLSIAIVIALSFQCATRASAQSTPAAEASPAAAPAAVAAASPAASPSAAPSPLPQPAVTGPLQTSAPYVIETGIPEQYDIGGSDFQHLSIDGVFSGIGIVQNNTPPTDRTDRMDVSNAQLIVQQPTGMVQFYLQGGAYDIPALGLPLTTAGTSISSLWGPLPVAFLKLAPTDSFSIQAGNLPTLIGAEYTFTFENVNVERGLLWNQENAVNRGVQLNYTLGPVSASAAWSNGFYSRSYTWGTGLISWAINSSNSIALVGGKNFGTDKHNSFVAPVFLNNSSIVNAIYTYNSAPWIIQPYFQWTEVPHNSSIGVGKATHTFGGAVLASYALTSWFALGARAEYIASTGNRSDGSVNLIYGPGSGAWSVTATPTFQWNRLFARPEFSFVHATSWTPGSAFGQQGKSPTQFRALAEFGMMF